MARLARTESIHGKKAPVSRANPVDVHVGRRLRMRRILLGLSQEKLGDSIGLTFQQIQKYEHGTNRISASRIYDLAQVLDVPVSFFFDNMDESIAGQSPRHFRHSDEIPKIAADPMDKRETLELVRAYSNIEDPRVRQKIVDLMKAVAKVDKIGMDAEV